MMSNRANINKQLFIAMIGLAVFIISGCPGGSSVTGPDVVTGLNAASGNKLVTLSWDEVELADTYNIYFSNAPGVSTSSEKISGITGLSYDHEGIANGVTYYYIVTAQNENGESEPSNVVTAMPLLDAVTGLNVVAGNKSAELSWNDVDNADTFNIYFSTDPGAGLGGEKISGITDLSYEHTEIINGLTYYYIVTAEDSDSEGEPSEEVNATPMYENEFAEILISPEIQAGDVFGLLKIDIDGNYAIVGAPWEDGESSDPAANFGAAYIFHRDDQGNWDQGVRLEAPDRQSSDWFGFSVSIHGSYAVVGAPMEEGGPGDPKPLAGAVYVFQRIDTNTWGTGVKLVALDAQGSDNFGLAVSIYSDYILVGASGEDGGPGDTKIGAGAAYVFHRIGNNLWDNGFIIQAPDAQTQDLFGFSVSIQGDQAVVGAYQEDGGPGDPLVNAGASYVFERIGNNIWSGGEKLVASDAQASDYFGLSVSLSGNRIVVGAYQEKGGDGDPLPGAGAAYLFEKTQGGTWEQKAILSAGADAKDSDQFGYSVNVDGDFVVVGSPYADLDDGGPIANAGAAYVFHENSVGVWEEVVKLTAGEDAQADDRFGFSVSITENYVIVGAPYEDGGTGDPIAEAGAVYVF